MSNPIKLAFVALTIAVLCLFALLAIEANGYTSATNPPRNEPNPRGIVIATEHQAAEICFPRGSWDAREEDRPCNVIFRPFEDGSSGLLLGTLGSEAASCIIPNPYEERGKFVIHCHRIPNR